MVAFIKKIFSILFVSYDICACFNFNSMLYGPHKQPFVCLKDPSYECFFSSEIMSIFQSDSRNSLSYQQVNVSELEKNIISIFKKLTINKNDAEGFKFDIRSRHYGTTNSVKEKEQSDMYYFLLGDNTPCAFITSKQQNKEGPKKPLLVYYMGNGETLLDFFVAFRDIRCPDFWRDLVEKYDILCPSLPGYFLNHTGDFSEKTRRSQINDVFEWCQKYYKDNVYILGFSLGCYFAILLAGRGNCKFLFLSNPFLTDKTAARWIVEHTIGCCGCVVSPLYKSKLDNGEEIKQVKCPIDFYYSLCDRLVNPQDAHTLYEIAKNNGNNQVSLLPHGQRRETGDKSYSKEESGFWNDIKGETYCMPIKSLYKIIDVSSKSRYESKHGDFGDSDVLRSRFAVG